MNLETCSYHEKLKIVNSFIHGDRNLPALNSTKYLKPIVGSRIVVKTPEGDITVKVLKEIKTEIFYSYQEKWVEETFLKIVSPLKEAEMFKEVSFNLICSFYESAYLVCTTPSDIFNLCKDELVFRIETLKKSFLKFITSKLFR